LKLQLNLRNPHKIWTCEVRWPYHRQLAGEIERYERIKRGEFDVLRNLERLGELLIAVRHLSLPRGANSSSSILLYLADPAA